MSALLSEKTDISEQSRTKTESPARLWLWFVAFITGFIPCLLHNLYFCESRIMLASDGKHFLTTVSLLVEFLKQHLNTPLAAKFLSESQLAGHITFDGPIMSLVYPPVFLLLNKIPTQRDWFTLAIGQSIFHGLSTALLSAIVLRLTKSPLFAVMAAVLFGLYPPAILQSGHFMSEMPVTTLLLAMLFGLTSNKNRFFSWLVAGICGGVIALSKPALIPCVALACVFALVKLAMIMSSAETSTTNGKADFLSFLSNPGARASGEQLRCTAHLQSRPLLNLVGVRQEIAGLLLGMLLVVAPWSIFSFKTSGSFIPTAQRQPLYNVVTGWNTEANGWAYSPHPPLTNVFSESDGPLPTAMGIWMSRPQESAMLALSKLSRLSSCPWNDFKGRAIGLDENAQILWHRLIIALAAFGVGIYAFCSRRYLDAKQRLTVELPMVIITAHLAYLMVECQPRYGFTAMPFAVLLAIYGIWQVSRLSFQDPIRRLIIFSSVACSLACTAFLLHAEDFCRFIDPRVLKEHNHTLSMQDRIEKNIDLSSVQTPADIQSVVLLVDGDKNLEKAELEINGVDLHGKLLSTNHFDTAHYALFDQLREFGPAMRISVDDFRQWRAIPVDKSLINWHGKNQIVVTSLAKNATIYGDRKNNRLAFSPDFCNYGVLAAAPYSAGAESRYTDPVLTAATPQQSFATTKVYANEDLSKDPATKDSAIKDSAKDSVGQDSVGKDSASESQHPDSAVNESSREGAVETVTNKLKDSLRVRLLVVLNNQNSSAPSSQLRPIPVLSSNQPSQLASPAVARNTPIPATVENSRSSLGKPATQTLKVSRKSFDRLLWDSSSNDCLRINKVILYAARTVGADITLPEIGKGSHIKISIKGELKALKNAGEVGLLCALKGKDKVQILGKTPRALAAKNTWHQFQIDDIVPLDSLGGKADAIELALYPCPWMEGQYGVSRKATDAVFRDITIEVSPADLPSISGRRIIY